MDETLHILVTGATGYLGGRLVRRLQKHKVRCLTRRPELLKNRWDGVEIAAGDLLDPETLNDAFQDIQVAYYLAISDDQHPDFEERERKAAHHFIDMAKKHGLRQIIYVGELGQSATHPSPLIRSRHEVGEILRSSGIPVTEFRASLILGSGSLPFELIRYLVERAPIIPYPHWMNIPCQPIAVRDIISYLLYALKEPKALGKTFDIGGPDQMTFKDLLKIYAKERKLKRLLFPFPIPTPKPCSSFLSTVTPIPEDKICQIMLKLREETLMQNDQAKEIFPVKTISCTEAIRLAREKICHSQVETTWRSDSSSVEKKYFFPPTHQARPRLEIKEGLIIERRQTVIPKSPEIAYQVFSGIGGARQWYVRNWAWKFRGLLDRMVGGIGYRAGRRHPDFLLPGDQIDFWRVEEVKPGEMIQLRDEMKKPGRAWLDMEVKPLEGSQSLFTLTAIYEPWGVLGYLYWFTLYPLQRSFHTGLCRAIKKRCSEELSLASPEESDLNVPSVP